MATRIDFHSNVSNQLDYACRLVRKALAAHCQLLVNLQDAGQLRQFDQLLWSFSATDFLPHVEQNESLARHTPVVLKLHSHSGPENHHNDILLNLSDSVPGHFAQFKRLIEIVPQEDHAIQAGRKRYRFYQQQGFQLNHIHARQPAQ